MLKGLNLAAQVVQQALKHNQPSAFGLAVLAEADRLNRRLEAIVLAGRDQVIELRAGETRYWTLTALWEPEELTLGSR